MSDTSPAGSTAAPRIRRTDVAHLARLARLAVTDQELDVFAGQLEVILSAVARVGEVAAADIPPTSHAVPLTNVLRDDEVRPSLPRDAVLASAPSVEDDKFRVPRILADEVADGDADASQALSDEASAEGRGADEAVAAP